MAQTVAVSRKGPSSSDVKSLGGAVRIVPFVLTISSYVTGGEALDLVAAGGFAAGAIKSVEFLALEQQNGRQFEFDRSTNKVLAKTSAGVEIANATNIGAVNGWALVRSA